MAGIVYYGTITPEQKKEIFEKTVLFLIGKRYDFSIQNGQGRMEYVELACPQLEMTLDLEFDSELSNSNLTCHTAKHSFMVNDFSQVINEIKKVEPNSINEDSINAINEDSINAINEDSINAINEDSINAINEDSINAINESQTKVR